MMEKMRKKVSENSHFPSEVKTVHAETFSGHLHLQYHMWQEGAMVSLTFLSQQIFALRDFLHSDLKISPFAQRGGSHIRIRCCGKSMFKMRTLKHSFKCQFLVF